MLAVTKQISLPIGHRLLNYDGPCKNIHGHNIKVELSFSSDVLTKQGFIIDFGIIKSSMGSWLNEEFDHGFFVNPYDTSLIDFLRKDGSKFYIMPSEFPNPTMENICYTIMQKAKKFAWQNRIKLQKIRLYESETGWVTLT